MQGAAQPEGRPASGGERPHEPPAPRRRRFVALLIDLAAATAAATAGSAVAVGWLMVATRWGRDDVTAAEVSLALALPAASLAGWYAALATSAARRRSTPGQQVAGVRVVARSPAAAVARVLVHPVGIPVWGGLALIFLLGGVRVVAAACGAIAAGLLLSALFSLVVLLRDPSGRPLHDRVAGTRLVPR